MSGFFDSEAEESGDELEEGKKLDEEEEEEEEDEDDDGINDIINDDPEEVEDEDEDAPRGRKRGRRDSEDDELDEDDLELIKENTGLKIKKKKHSRVKILESDEEDEESQELPSREREEIAHELFEDETDQQQGMPRSRDREAPAEAYTAIDDIGSEEEEEDEFDFIVDDDGQPIGKPKKKKNRVQVGSSALLEAQDIFGLEFDLSELDQYGDDDLDEDREEDYEFEGEEEGTKPKKKIRKKPGRKSIYEIYEPSELEKSHLTDKDNEIKVNDVPERFQLRVLPMKLSSESELDVEAEWIYSQAFLQNTLSQVQVFDSNEYERRQQPTEKPITAIPKIKAALNFMKKELFEVPFIATYRKEYIEPELKPDDLWKIYEWDEKWSQLGDRKDNMKKLFQSMQEFQFEKMRENPDQPLDDAFRALEQQDIAKVESASTMEELMDIYSHFQLYYSNDIPLLKEWQTSKKKTRKKKKKEPPKKTPVNEETGEKEGESSSDKTEGTDGKSGEENKEEGEEKDSNNSEKDKEDGGKENEKDEAQNEAEEVDAGEGEKSGEDEVETEAEKVHRKLPRRRDLYTICRDCGLGTLAKHFGLTPDQFAENLRDNYQRHEPDQYPQEPRDAAEEFVCTTFPTAETVLAGARHMVAMQIARDPLVKKFVREVFYERAKLSITPTKKGKKDIDDFHSYASFKYIKYKPIRDLQGDQYLKMNQAEKDGLLVIKITVDENLSPGYTSYIDEVKMLYYRDEFSNLVQEWNDQRTHALTRAFQSILYPLFEKELKTKLLQESTDFVIQSAARKIRNWISVAPYQVDRHFTDELDYAVESESGHGCRIAACSFLPDMNASAFLVLIDSEGQVADFIRLRNILKRRSSQKGKDREEKERDLDLVKKFVLKHRPHVIAVSAECRDTQMVVDDFRFAVSELEQEQQVQSILVEMIDGEVARVYQSSPRAETDFRDYPALLRHAISIGRRLQDPLTEFAGLFDAEDEILCLRLHTLQELVPKDSLMRAIEIEFINRTNDVGVDLNRVIDNPHIAVLVQFICGLGPRKGGNLLKVLKQMTSRLENRSQLVTVCGMGPQVFLNCAGFIRIDTSAIGDNVEVLDGSRIHPETYDWARKMAVDALEYDEGMEDNNPGTAVEEILEQPDRLKDLDLDAFADELARQGYGNKQITLYDIRDELINRFKDHRIPYRQPSAEEKFRLMTGETGETMFVGRLITCMVTGFAYRKPPREALDQANPVRNDDTRMWQCPFCLGDNFPDLSEVWTHFDNGSCPGQAVGVKTRLDSGITGFVATKNISDKIVKRPEERVHMGMTVHCRVLKINMERFQVDLTCKSSDLADKEGKFSPPKDLYFDQDMSDKDKKHSDAEKNTLARRTTYIRRVIAHPSFKNITFKQAEEMLDTLDQGECLFRPSSKVVWRVSYCTVEEQAAQRKIDMTVKESNAHLPLINRTRISRDMVFSRGQLLVLNLVVIEGGDHLTVSWKVEKNIYQHIDIKEESKDKVFSLGRSLWIENEEYEDLDEIIARHIQPMAAHARDILNHRYYRETDGGNKQKLEEVLATEKRKNPSRIPYFFSSAKNFPGKFMLGYMPRNKQRVEYVTVTPDGYRYRGRVHGSLNGLLRWFKEHFRDPIPGVTPKFRTPNAMSESNTPYTPGGTPHSIIMTDVDPSALMQQIQQAFPAGIPNQGYNAALAAVQFQQNQGTPSTPNQQPQWNTYVQQYQQQFGNVPGFQQQQQQQQAQQQYAQQY